MSEIETASRDTTIAGNYRPAPHIESRANSAPVMRIYRYGALESPRTRSSSRWINLRSAFFAGAGAGVLPVSTQSLQVSTWIGGFITVSNVIAALVLVLFIKGIIDKPDSIGFEAFVIYVILCLFFFTSILLGVGFAIGLIRGRLGNILFAISFLPLLAITLLGSTSGDIASAWKAPTGAAALIGPYLLGWSLSRRHAVAPKDINHPV